GMALLFRRGDREQQTADAHNYVSVMKAAGEDLDYYFLAAWEQELDGIKTKEEFVAYLENEAQQLTLAPRVQMNTAYSAVNKSLPVAADEALSWAKKMADSGLQREILNYRYGGWDVG